MIEDPAEETALPSPDVPGGLFRVDSAAVLKRFHHLERELMLACAAWIPACRRLETKAALAEAAWQDALTADALRTRVYELKYPDRSLDPAGDAALVAAFAAARHAPGAPSLLTAVTRALLPAVQSRYAEYLAASDEVADGPTHRFLTQALRDKDHQRETLSRALEDELALPGAERVDEGWLDALAGALAAPQDGASAEVLPGGRPWALAEVPGRDDRYFANPFYWPDNFDPGIAYGHGRRLQLRSAVSHVNEVWAVDTAAANLVGLAEELGWEFCVDAARWLYDESRHMTMGRTRLERWGFAPGEIPLGTYIYDACRGQDPLLRLAMLAYFETKNIGKKRDRLAELHTIGDDASARDMDFDWADEGIHAAYGRRWMKQALEGRGRPAEDWHQLRDTCERLVAEQVAAHGDRERSALAAVTERLLERADAVAAGTP